MNILEELLNINIKRLNNPKLKNIINNENGFFLYKVNFYNIRKKNLANNTELISFHDDIELRIKGIFYHYQNLNRIYDNYKMNQPEENSIETYGLRSNKLKEALFFEFINIIFYTSSSFDLLFQELNAFFELELSSRAENGKRCVTLYNVKQEILKNFDSENKIYKFIDKIIKEEWYLLLKALRNQVVHSEFFHNFFGFEKTLCPNDNYRSIIVAFEHKYYLLDELISYIILNAVDNIEDCHYLIKDHYDSYSGKNN